MDPVESFTGEVLDRDTGAGVEFIFLGYGDIPERPNLETIGRDLELTSVARVHPDGDDPNAVSLSEALLSIILADAAERSRFSASTPDSPGLRDALAPFLEYVLHEPVVPVRRNPLGLEALATLATGAGAGVMIGFVAAGGPTPLLIITVPAGIVFVKVASGVGQGLSDVLHYRIRKWFRVPDDFKGA